ILTTNMKSAIDKAFFRRIRFIINFMPPDAALRTEIWQKVFPKRAEKGDLQYEKLARISLPGGNIKNIALNAAFLAAAAGESIEMKHLLHATRGEYSKLEKTLSRSEVKDWV
ncbi:MAG: ATP-binding protein, partial [Bacteroidota bacterium]